jgi:5,10-methylenetetrahydrofolate reductase
MDFPDYPTEQERAARIEKFWRTVEAAKAVLKPGDRIRVTQCPGTKRKSYYAASTIDRLNGEPVGFV